MGSEFRRTWLAVGLAAILVGTGGVSHYWMGGLPSAGVEGTGESGWAAGPRQWQLRVLACEADQAPKEEVGETQEAQQAGPSPPESVSGGPPQGIPDEREWDAILDRVNRAPLLRTGDEAGSEAPTGTESHPGKDGTQRSPR